MDAHEAGELDRDAFVARFGGVVEHAPWVAEAAWPARPFASVDDLHRAFAQALQAAPRDARVAVIRAHPDLAGRAAIAGELTAESAREQSAAGLDRLTPAQHGLLLERTAAYRQRFGFPFVICAREHTADTIIAEAGRRLEHDDEAEERAALAEVAKIARLRLADLVEE